MTSLSGKSAEEIREMLDELGIKHGPVVDSTRSLYEKKIKEALAKERKAKPSSDKTFYREEEEEVTYIHRTPSRNEVIVGGGGGDRMSNLRSRPLWSERQYEPEPSYSTSPPRFGTGYGGRDAVDAPDMYDTPASYRSSYLQSTPLKSSRAAPAAAAAAAARSSASGSGSGSGSGLVPMWVQLLVFLALAVFLYLVFSSMESDESLKSIE
ncbi:unnamed protein product [Ophioblennius macclurei]